VIPTINVRFFPLQPSTLPTLPPCAARPARAAFQTKGSGYNTRLPPRFFAHISAKPLRAHLRSGLNLVPCVE
jgi:hypothetical protein